MSAKTSAAAIQEMKTPEKQIRRSHSVTTTEAAMMKLLLHDSQETQISPITHVSETGGESLKTLPCTKAPSTAADTHPEASESNVETETDSQTTETQSESQHTSVPPTEESQSQSSPETNRESSTDEKLNESSISSSSQAAETRDQTSNDVVDQDEFLAKVLKKCQQRVLLKPHTKNLVCGAILWIRGLLFVVYTLSTTVFVSLLQASCGQWGLPTGKSFSVRIWGGKRRNAAGATALFPKAQLSCS